MKPQQTDDETCSVSYVHQDVVQETKESMFSQEKAEELASLFNAMGDPTRVRLLYALSKAELCVCDLQEILEMSQSAVSHQLRLLRNLRLVKFRRQGRMVFYSLDDEHIYRLFSEGLNHIEHQ